MYFSVFFHFAQYSQAHPCCYKRQDFFLQSSNIPACVCVCVLREHVSHSLYPFTMDTGSFRVLATVNNAAVTLGCRCPFQMVFSVPSDSPPEARLMDHRAGGHRVPALPPWGPWQIVSSLQPPPTWVRSLSWVWEVSPSPRVWIDFGASSPSLCFARGWNPPRCEGLFPRRW